MTTLLMLYYFNDQKKGDTISGLSSPSCHMGLAVTQQETLEFR